MNIIRCTPNIEDVMQLVIRKYGLPAPQGYGRSEEALRRHAAIVLTVHDWKMRESLSYSFLEDETIVGFMRLHELLDRSRVRVFYIREFCFGGEPGAYRPTGGISAHELLRLRIRLARDFPQIQRLAFTTHQPAVGKVFREMFTELYRIEEVPDHLEHSRQVAAQHMQPDYECWERCSGLPDPDAYQGYIGVLISAEVAEQRLAEICEAAQAWSWVR